MKLSENVKIALSVLIVAALLVALSAFFANRADETPANSADESSQQDTSDKEQGNASEALGENSSSNSILAVLDRLTIADETQMDEYDRKEFKHWIGAAGADCDARDAVLKEESNPPIASDAPCPINEGKWLSLYDGKLITDPGKIDIDHMVPLAEAWRSGAHAWTDEQREQYANDMGDSRSLIAVSAGSNRSKSDQDPDEWLPTSEDYLCTYLADWVAVKFRWDLTLEQAEYDAIKENSADCEVIVLMPEKALN